MQNKEHWEQVYTAKKSTTVSWNAPHLTDSLAYIRRTGLPKSTAIIDVGGGESTLMDDLLDEGYTNLSILDISSRALNVCRQRLGERAERVNRPAANVLEEPFVGRSVDIRHDRAVFHFLTHEDQRCAYVAQVLQALWPDGYAIVGAFGPDGPTQCSGLPVARYAAGELHGEFGGQFRLVESTTTVHTTPSGAPQQFVYCFCRLR